MLDLILSDLDNLVKQAMQIKNRWKRRVALETCTELRKSLA